MPVNQKKVNYKLGTYKAFTLIELLVAIGLLVIVISFAGVIFRVSINAYRTATANADIMQKLRAITSQLNADFQGLRKDGEIFVIWAASPVLSTGYQDNDLDGYERFDRIMFFTEGDFQSYGVDPMVRGNVARITYILARRNGRAPQIQTRAERMLVRNQHILTVDPALASTDDPNNFTDDQQWYSWNNYLEYDKTTLDEWKLIPWSDKKNMLSVICDVEVGPSNVGIQVRGSEINPGDPNSIHLLLCEGVGEFKIQGWSDMLQRWVPEVDPDGDGLLTDTDFVPAQDGTGLDPEKVPGVLYPYRSWYDSAFVDPNNYFQINNMSYPGQMLNQINFNNIPGLGRALKFTFTLFDSKGIIKEGRTFTHIVYLDD